MNNNDLIYRSDGINSFYDEICDICADIAAEKIRAIPAVPQPRKGKWVQSDLDSEFVTCSYCKEHEIEGRRAFRPDYAETMNFCPNCGADMRERSEE